MASTSNDQVTFYAGSKEEFSAASARNENGIYFLKNSQEIYKGDTLYRGPVATNDTPGVVKPVGSQFTVKDNGELELTQFSPSSISVKTENGNISLDTYLQQLAANTTHLKYQIVESLPTKDIDNYTIYLLSANNGDLNVYDEYMYINSKWELIGTSQAALKNYTTKSELSVETEARISADDVIKSTLGDGFSTNSTVKQYVDDTRENAVNDVLTLLPSKISSSSSGTITIEGQDGSNTKTVLISGWDDIQNNVSTNSQNISNIDSQIKSIDTTINSISAGEGINKASKSSYGVVEIGSGLNVDNGIISVISPFQGIVNSTSIDWSAEGAVSSDYINWGESTNVTNKNIKSVLQSSGVIEDLNLVKRKIVATLPTSYIEKNTIYMIKKSDGSQDNNIYNEYMWVESDSNSSGSWELIGDTKTSLEGYLTEETANNTYLNVNSVIAESGSQKGTILIRVSSPNGNTSENKTYEVAVNGLGSAAFTDSTAYATPTDLYWNDIE